MKLLVTGVLCFVIGWLLCLQFNTDSVESAEFKNHLIDMECAALEQAEIVMDNNNIWEKDTSQDIMLYYMYCDSVSNLLDSQL